MPNREFDSRSLPVEAFAREAEALAGELPIESLDRLREVQVQGAAEQGGSVARWTARGEWRTSRAGPKEVWLHLTAQAELRVPCQRCLESVEVAVDAARSFLFVHGEAQAAALDEQFEEDVLPLTRSLDLIALVEDELLLALPLVPRHLPACPAPLPVPASDPLVDGQAHPFAALAALNRSAGKLN